MVQDLNHKTWHPARFTRGGIHGSGDEPLGFDVVKQHAVIILNNPLKNKDFLVDVCTKGMYHLEAKSPSLPANIRHELVALYVLTAEQIDSTICT